MVRVLRVELSASRFQTGRHTIATLLCWRYYEDSNSAHMITKHALYQMSYSTMAPDVGVAPTFVVLEATKLYS